MAAYLRVYDLASVLEQSSITQEWVYDGFSEKITGLQLLELQADVTGVGVAIMVLAYSIHRRDDSQNPSL